jgi:hypothetical protein
MALPGFGEHTFDYRVISLGPSGGEDHLIRPASEKSSNRSSGLVYQTVRNPSMGVKGRCVPRDFLERTFHGFSDFLRNRRGGVMVEIGVSGKE